MTRRAPATKTATRTQTAVTTTTRKRRLTKVEPREGQTLTSKEENTLRMHFGLDAGLHQPLPTNAINAALRQQLLEIELRAYEATGRYKQRDEDDEDESTARSPKDKIISQLRSR
ncbi:MAG: hypothetical protein AB2A00_26745 [Myxococcota bacterium]